MDVQFTFQGATFAVRAPTAADEIHTRQLANLLGGQAPGRYKFAEAYWCAEFITLARLIDGNAPFPLHNEESAVPVLLTEKENLLNSVGLWEAWVIAINNRGNSAAPEEQQNRPNASGTPTTEGDGMNSSSELTTSYETLPTVPSD